MPHCIPIDPDFLLLLSVNTAISSMVKCQGFFQDLFGPSKCNDETLHHTLSPSSECLKNRHQNLMSCGNDQHVFCQRPRHIRFGKEHNQFETVTSGVDAFSDREMKSSKNDEAVFSVVCLFLYFYLLVKC